MHGLSIFALFAFLYLEGPASTHTSFLASTHTPLLVSGNAQEAARVQKEGCRLSMTQTRRRSMLWARRRRRRAIQCY